MEWNKTKNCTTLHQLHFKLFIFFLLSFCFFNTHATPSPTNTDTFEIEGDALYWQNTSNYVNQRVLTSTQLYNLDYDWGFRLSGRYFLPKNRDLLLEWFYYKQSQSLIDNQGAIFQSRQRGQVFTEKNGITLVNLTWGQLSHLSDAWSFRMMTGLQYGILEGQLLVANPVGQSQVKDTIIGPAFGLALDYSFLYKFRAFTKFMGIGYYNTESLRSSGASDILRERGSNANLIDQDVGMGVNYSMGLAFKSPVQQGVLTSVVQWSFFVYQAQLNRVGWTGLSFGLRWKE